MIPKAMRIAWRDNLRPRWRDAGRLVDVARSVIVVDPMLGTVKIQRGERPDDDQEHPAQCRCVAHLEIYESSFIQVEGVEQGGVSWPAGAAADNEGWRERLERPDDLQNDVKEDHRSEEH